MFNVLKSSRASSLLLPASDIGSLVTGNRAAPLGALLPALPPLVTRRSSSSVLKPPTPPSSANQLPIFARRPFDLIAAFASSKAYHRRLHPLALSIGYFCHQVTAHHCAFQLSSFESLSIRAQRASSRRKRAPSLSSVAPLPIGHRSCHTGNKVCAATKLLDHHHHHHPPLAPVPGPAPAPPLYLPRPAHRPLARRAVALTASTASSIVSISYLSFCPCVQPFYTRPHSLYPLIFRLGLLVPDISQPPRLVRSRVTASESEARELPSPATSFCASTNTVYPCCCDRAEPHQHRPQHSLQFLHAKLRRASALSSSPRNLLRDVNSHIVLGHLAACYLGR